MAGGAVPDEAHPRPFLGYQSVPVMVIRLRHLNHFRCPFMLCNHYMSCNSANPNLFHACVNAIPQTLLHNGTISRTRITTLAMYGCKHRQHSNPDILK